MRRVVDHAIKSSGKSIQWLEILAGEKAFKQTKQWLPAETLQAIRDYTVAIKGPLTTPVGTGIRSLNVTMRQELDLYACVRPVRYFKGVESPLKRPEDTDVVIFRENTEDVYAGIEWEASSPQAVRVRQFLKQEYQIELSPNTGIGIKPISKEATERLVRKAMVHAIENQRRVVTVVHKGNIMKFTEGAFKNWAFDCIREEFGSKVAFEQDLQGARHPLARSWSMTGSLTVCFSRFYCALKNTMS